VVPQRAAARWLRRALLTLPIAGLTSDQRRCQRQRNPRLLTTVAHRDFGDASDLPLVIGILDSAKCEPWVVGGTKGDFVQTISSTPPPFSCLK